MLNAARTASLYVRLSKDARDTNLSLLGMLDDVRALAVQEGYSVVAEHVDEGISGAVRDRPAFRAWLDDAISGRADALLTYHADRLTREGVNAAALILDVVEGKDPFSGRVVRSPVRLRSVDGLDSNEADSFRWRFVIAAEVARAERERIKARNLATRARLDKAGRFTGGRTPFGTRAVLNPAGPGKVLVRDDDEAALLGEVAERLRGGESVRGVVRWLNTVKGSRTRSGMGWTRSSLRATLLSTASRTHVFDLATYRAVERALATTPATTPPDRGGRPPAYLLSGGLGICGSCGRKMTTSYGRTGPRYVCSSTSQGLPCPATVSIDAAQTDAWIGEEYLWRYGALDYQEERIVLLGGDDLDDAERALEDAQAALLASPTAEALATYQRAQERFEAAKAVPQTREKILFPTGLTNAQRWEQADPPGRSALLLDALADVVTILPNPGGRPRGRQRINFEGRVVVPWKVGENPRYYTL